MKQISVGALLFVLVLGALFVYVAEDIPDFGDPNSAPNRYTPLFTLDAAGSVDVLNQGNVPEALIEALTDRGFRDYELPTSVKGLTAGEWDAYLVPEETYYNRPTAKFGTAPDAPKEQKYFYLKQEGDKLEVYRYAPIIRYVEEGEHETEVPNMVTYILADYRGYDTLGETTVIFTAGLSVILLLRRRGKQPT
jgi:hypothetical protein